MKYLLLFDIRILQSQSKLSAASNVQEHATLLQMIIDTVDGTEDVDYDAVYEDILECMVYGTNVISFLFQNFSSLVY